MCGIFSYICTNNNSTEAEEMLESCRNILKNRGPNYESTLWYDAMVLFYGSVLWHQGVSLSQQPMESDQTVLMFNGDIFQKREDMSRSDTMWLLERIEACADETDLINLFASLHGPFSVIFLRKEENRIYFARDSIGRNSLLIGRGHNGNTFISSVGGNVGSYVVHELPPYGLYFIDLERVNESNSVTLLPWTDDCTQLQPINPITIQPAVQLKIPQALNITPYNFNFYTLLEDEIPLGGDVFDCLFKYPEINNVCNQLLGTLRNAVEERITNTILYCKMCLERQSECIHPKVGILFSGGIDCTILAFLADEFVPTNCPIDLMNVAFEKVRRTNVKPAQMEWNVPDRVTGQASLDELRRLRPNRTWNFVEINVSRCELNEKRKVISNLVFPLRNVLDESLGAALWFASNGVGQINGRTYTSTCRVLLLGSGADELFGGYTRHKTAFERNFGGYSEKCSSDLRSHAYQKAYEALEEELNLDWRRLPSRNLARDDRVISDNGVTPRTPYLQEDFIALVRSLKASQRCYHPLGLGIGDKLILRLCAYKLGLTQACMQRKRALQFGSRIADRKQNASDRSTYLEN
ncbi:asparagine synthetase domain-containing protein CG17486 [Anopheles marshallii]|uniref:asparagine synthetase domain-containing protein CG17486 n=1 Tax=Anopheles marshallii TaxID=1521116 RepID=UPI00237B5CC2|nr:asparagine synthetase domain-containing protein CG17486 [Anopheles marshallii]